ncbi:DNA mismatch repair protein MutL [Rhodopirellula sallentina SM41]|uniref:DNA mismatch repair protein MutL n=2 Tax=Rhodopirellula TaxID=265488 RepID=M5TYS6_9BACT|nr:DNA mismatch repair protein MutL [Rhodopirellula sallentina SM41]
MQYLFLNGRHIRDRALQHALGEAYRGLLMVGRHPVCFLRMTMPPEMIDVNVHPAKLEVRFTDSGRVYSRLLQTLRQRFLSTDMTHRVGAAPAPEPMKGDDLRSRGESVMGMPAREVDEQRQSVIEWARTGQDAPENRGVDISASSTVNRIDGATVHASPVHSQPSQSQTPGTSSGVSPSGLGGVPNFRPFSDGGASVLPGATVQGDGSAVASPANDASDSVAPWDLEPDATSSANAGVSGAVDGTGPSPSVCYLGFQVRNRYLVTQDEKGMVVIDQHALHERVLYERVCQKVLGENASLEAQRLLVPEPVSLTPAERAAALEVRDTLARIGLEIEDFGGETILIQSYPAIMPNKDPADMLRTILESVMGAGRDPNPKDLLNHLLSTVACKAAVKAGDPLSPEEITSLLEQKDLYQDTHHCPHGRPTALFFSLDELDRMFGRLGPRGRVTT